MCVYMYVHTHTYVMLIVNFFTFITQGEVKPVPCDGPIKHSDTPLCVAKKAMAQALQAEKDVIAAHEKIAQQKERITRLDSSFREHYQAMEMKFEVYVYGCGCGYECAAERECVRACVCVSSWRFIEKKKIP